MTPERGPRGSQEWGSPQSESTARNRDLAQIIEEHGFCPFDDTSSDESETERAQPLSGVELILHKLSSAFPENEQTQVMEVLDTYRNFRKKPQETMEEAFARWDMLEIEMRRQGQGDSLQSVTHTALNWLVALEIPKIIYPLLLSEWDKNFPTTTYK